MPMNKDDASDGAATTKLERRARYLAARPVRLSVAGLLSPGDARKLPRRAKERFRLNAGEAVNVPKLSAARVLSGSIDLILRQEGQQALVARIGPGEMFGDVPMLGIQMFDMQAVAGADCEVALISQQALERVLFGSDEAVVSILRGVGGHLVDCEMDGMLEAFGRVQTRVIRVVLRLAASSESISDLSQRELGDMLGRDRVTISRELADLAKRGLIETSHKAVRIVDLEGLTALMWEGLR
jgi:CRP-like cAMP-binding protein